MYLMQKRSQSKGQNLMLGQSLEQNLEQNSSKEQKQQEQSGSFKSTRKNINMSSLDEMSGIMTEEENLVAQIMHDNGNSVDFMA